MSAPRRPFFVIRRWVPALSDLGPVLIPQYFNVAHVHWWADVHNATWFVSHERALAYCSEFLLPQGDDTQIVAYTEHATQIVAYTEHATLDTQIDDDGDPDHGEDWKK